MNGQKKMNWSQILGVMVIASLPLSVTLNAADGDIQKANSGEELILNGSMEEGNPPDSWRGNNATLSASSDCHSGKQSLKILASANLGGAIQTFAVKPDTQYQLDLWLKCSDDELYVNVCTKAQSKVLYGGLKGNSEAGWTHWIATFKTPNLPEATTAWVALCATLPDRDTLVVDVSIKEVKSSSQTDATK